MRFELGGCEVTIPEGDCETEVSENACDASVAGHRCRFDNGDLDHFDPQWDGEGPWLLGVRHCCACHPSAQWPEIY